MFWLWQRININLCRRFHSSQKRAQNFKFFNGRTSCEQRFEALSYL